MPVLTDVIQIIPPDRDEDPEDIFAAAPGLIFTDDFQNLHGDKGYTIVYKSKWGPIELKTADPQAEGERQLFSHYLWNASISLAERISYDGAGGNNTWSVKGERVLELGAGTNSSLLAVSISDYPSEVVLANIRENARKNIPKHLSSNYTVDPHEWGDCDSSFATKHAHFFTRILAADCYWMPGQHLNLVRSMLHFLTLDPGGRIYAIAGFHTGRRKLAPFFTVAVEQGLELEDIFEEDGEGNRREWQTERDGGREDPTERKKWLVIATLKRRS
ncbi:hypothetical protein D0869_06394 [Hortaea werneckii]|uniref:Uncharacterized protein n=1 Tax=Hortaea werneckii TaxID=91943 RepID=A0A3M6WU65_HORWE|nr:hypothetical protein D0869_06394 [Hortaea werneckii]RMY12087.1 hypothetical protein D0868_02764 [Hortaea werneckii]